MVPAYKPAELTTAIFVVNVHGHGLEPVTEKAADPVADIRRVRTVVDR
jgi:hypothetical protein